MLAVYLTVPIACFRKGLAREFLETEPLPPPSTCYGFLLSLVGETSRQRHIGCRVTPAMLNEPALSVVLRTVWRVKKVPLGSSGNTRPDYQQVMTGIELLIWLDSTEEDRKLGPTLESRVREALTSPEKIQRFGGLSLGESTHMVDEVSLLDDRMRSRLGDGTRNIATFLSQENGRLSLPVWVDHVGSAQTRYQTGDLIPQTLETVPLRERLPVIQPLAN